MMMDDEMLYDFMSQYKVIGEVAFGGTGTREEDILVGYIYGVLSSSPNSTLEKSEIDYEMFSFGGYRYIVWMDEIDHDDEEDIEEEMPEETPMVRIEQVGESDNDLTDEDIEEFMENVEDDLFPVAIEGPLTTDELREKFGEEF